MTFTQLYAAVRLNLVLGNTAKAIDTFCQHTGASIERAIRIVTSIDLNVKAASYPELSESHALTIYTHLLGYNLFYKDQVARFWMDATGCGPAEADAIALALQ